MQFVRDIARVGGSRSPFGVIEGRLGITTLKVSNLQGRMTGHEGAVTSMARVVERRLGYAALRIGSPQLRPKRREATSFQGARAHTATTKGRSGRLAVS